MKSKHYLIQEQGFIIKFLFIFLIVSVTICNNVQAQSDTTAVPTENAVSVKTNRIRPGQKDAGPIVKSDNGKVVRVHTTDSAMRKSHNPKIAAALSAVIPGAGQIYNRKWWKVPIVYAGLGASGYFIYYYAVQTKSYQTEYRYRANGETDKLNPQYANFSDENVLALKNNYRRSMEIAIAAAAIIYALNILDATVDAHLFYFDISDDLSLSVQPFVRQNQFARSAEGGVGLQLRF